MGKPFFYGYALYYGQHKTGRAHVARNSLETKQVKTVSNDITA